MKEQFWTSPLYRMKDLSGKDVLVDVTHSISAGLPAKSTILEAAPFLTAMGVDSICDFGAGALRNVMPLLSAGFQVSAVEHREVYRTPLCQQRLASATAFNNFKGLVPPRAFAGHKNRYDAALLCYVLQIMPLPEEREVVLSVLHQKLGARGLVLYASRFGQISRAHRANRCSDGFFLHPKRRFQTFYREFTTAETHALFLRHGFVRVKRDPLRKRGTDQVFMYSKVDLSWNDVLERK